MRCARRQRRPSRFKVKRMSEVIFETAPTSVIPADGSMGAPRPRTFFCYLLASTCSHATYIGASTNPWRRLRQHNGEVCGGAKATHRQRPWRLHVVVCGFHDWNETLRFEWAWKHEACRRRVTRGLGARTRRAQELAAINTHLVLRYVPCAPRSHGLS